MDGIRTLDDRGHTTSGGEMQVLPHMWKLANNTCLYVNKSHMGTELA